MEASEHFRLTMEPTSLEQRRNCGRHVLNRIPKSKIFWGSKGADWIVWKNNSPSASHFGGILEIQIRFARAIPNGLLNNHDKSLDTESLQTLLMKCEAILNSRPLTVDAISDVNSPAPLAPTNILTMKSKVISPLPGDFERTEIFSKRR